MLLDDDIVFWSFFIISINCNETTTNNYNNLRIDLLASKNIKHNFEMMRHEQHIYTNELIHPSVCKRENNKDIIYEVMT